jgi:ATP-dependent Zn protease
MEKKQDEIEAAYHEAGHAVAALVLSHRFKDVLIGPRKNRLKYPKESLEGVWSDAPDHQRQHIIISMAGAASSEIRTGKPPDWDAVAYGGDREAIVDLLLRGGPNHDSQFQELYSETLGLLRGHWKAVEAIAKALLEHKRLSYKQVKAIYDAAG